MADDLIAAVPGPVRMVDLGTHDVAYVDLGAGDPIVFLHGGLMDHQSWGNQIALAECFRLILPDTRGHGRSGGGALPATYSAFADDVIALMDAFGLDRASLVGFSDGGCSALHTALRHPERVANLVVIGTPYSLSAYEDGVVDHFHAMTIEGLEATARPLVREVVSKMRQHMSEDEWRDYWQRIVKGLWIAEPNFSLSDFAAMTVRTLILHGEHEPSVSRRSSEELAATIPDCRLVYVPGASHSAAQDEPAFVNDAISRFLREVPVP